jgi:pSer/pThr/pTyr-binding forkhead associated (FHA) protein
MEPSRSATITFLSGPRDGETVRVPDRAAPPEAVIGRGANCALVLPGDPDVSRQHARLSSREDGWFLEDMESRNGTFVGEFAASRRIDSPTRLEPGAVFRVGNTRMRLEAADSPAEPARSLEKELEE